ncbi:hypothetical protein ACQ7HM_11715 [Williamsia sp. MIQD14]|uniref:hypothetical protein n=1 Tax=Williamsia sp. MIQD14 TaxID=3425703 RepID=UPI003DA14EFB
MAERSDDDRAVLTTRTTSATVMVTAMVALSAGCGWFSDGTESYRPPDAPISSRASCTEPDILAGFGVTASDDLRPGEGSVPDGFRATTVVSCQTADGPGGTTTVDEVELAGDVDAFVRAVDRPSVRTDKNTSVSCAFGVDAPVAIWLVSDAGAIRVAWPRVVCGFRDEPLAALEALTEIRRTQVGDLGVIAAGICRGSSVGFARTDGGGSRPVRERLLRFPTRTVAGATVCTYRTSRSSTGDLRLSGAEARRVTGAIASRLLAASISAPGASDCDTDATEVAVMPLRRPDGSGGATLTVETDGCRRISLDGGAGYRAASGEVTALLRGES